MSDPFHCPCGSGRVYAACCGPLLDGTLTARNAEQLMRSRYTAYTLDRLDYVLDTWHPHTRPATLEPQPEAQWLGLEILRTEDGRPGDKRGVVEFVARSKSGGRAQRLHESSRFVVEQDSWWYVDGDIRQR